MDPADVELMSALQESMEGAIRMAYEEWTATGPSGRRSAPGGLSSLFPKTPASVNLLPSGASSSGSSAGRREAETPPEEANARTLITWEQLETAAEETVDIDSVVRRELDRTSELRTSPLKELPLGKSSRSRRWPRWILALACIAALGAVIAGDVAGDHEATPARRSTFVAPALPPVAPSPAVSPPSRRLLQSVHRIRARLVFSASCWVRAVANGQAALVGTFASGSRTVTASRTLALRLGNAGGVMLWVDGRRVPTGSSGQVVDLSFALQGGKVVPLTG